MKIEIVEPFGYCAGVANAIKLAYLTKEKNQFDNVVVLGMLVHNKDALQTLKNHGINTVYKEGKTLLELINDIPSKSVVILTAHGHSDKVIKKLEKRGLKYVDATCPFVTASLNEIRSAIDAGRDVIYLGKKNHPEANAALSIAKNVYLVEPTHPFFDKKLKRPLLISQTTFSQSEIDTAINSLSIQFKDLEVVPSVCHASSTRQQALIDLSQKVELIYVVGGLNSNNTKTLFKIASSTHPKAKVIAVQNKDEINKKDLIGLSYIAISSGASTPREITLEIKSTIESLLN